MSGYSVKKIINEPDPEVVFEFLTVSGKRLRRSFTLQDAPDDPEIPPWLGDVRKIWINPADPIKYTGFVAKGCEAKARQWLRDLKPSGGK